MGFGIKPLLYLRDLGTPQNPLIIIIIISINCNWVVTRTTWYNFYGLSLQPDDGPHVGPKHVVVGTLIILIIEANIVVFDCAYSTRNSLPRISNIPVSVKRTDS